MPSVIVIEEQGVPDGVALVYGEELSVQMHGRSFGSWQRGGPKAYPHPVESAQPEHVSPQAILAPLWSGAEGGEGSIGFAVLSSLGYEMTALTGTAYQNYLIGLVQ